MGKVNKLSEEVFSKIAAGEVIERPSNVLKELIENSIDANSTVINVRILGNGLKLIEVRDNGIGIEKEDLPLVIERYTTSKINTEKDLLAVQTYGFRGEALYAISRVSNLQIISKTSDQDKAYILTSSEGKILKIEPTTFNYKNGTIVKVMDLFFNSPVRKNFLSSEKVELDNIVNTFKQFSAINNHVMFTLHIEDKLKYNLIPTTPESRVKEIFKISEPAKEELKIQDYKITIILSREYKYSEKLYTAKNNFFIFVNRRIVFMNELERIVVTTFREVFGERGKIEGIISITCPPDEVDSNVHPRKLEVRFLKPLLIKNMIQKAIKNFINNHVVSKVLIDIPREEKPKNIQEINWYRSIKQIVEKLEEKAEKISENSIEKTDLDISKIEFVPKIDQRQTIEIFRIESQRESIAPKILHYWENCYFLVLYKDSFFIVDQHNASEKIIYSHLLKRIEINTPIQKLLIPISIKTIQLDEEKMESKLNLLKNLGFTASYDKSQNLVQLFSYPAVLNINSVSEMIKTILQEFEETILDNEEVYREFIAKISCKAAIKKGQKLSNEELQKLFQDLISIDNLNPHFCPHGRNVMIEISFTDINKMFERNNTG